jgi:hypothetical protein
VNDLARLQVADQADTLRCLTRPAVREIPVSSFRDRTTSSFCVLCPRALVTHGAPTGHSVRGLKRVASGATERRSAAMCVLTSVELTRFGGHLILA